MNIIVVKDLSLGQSIGTAEMALEALLGGSLSKNDGSEIKTTDLPSGEGAVIGLYFSAHWCGPCRSFTPQLSTVYNEIKSAGHDFEIVFISWDDGEDSFKNYHKEMPWLAVPFSNKEKKDACSEKFDVDGIPALVLLNAATGEIISSDGREVIDSHGAAGFPFTESRLKECKKEKEESLAKALQDMASSSFILPLETIAGGEENRKETDLQTIANSCEALAFAFVKGRFCQGSSVVLPSLVDIRQTLGKEKLEIIIVPLEGMDTFDDKVKTKIADIPIIEFGTKSKEIVKKFEEIIPKIESPHVLLIGTDAGSSLKIHATNAARDIYFIGAAGFPWSSEAIEAMKAKEEALKEETKTRMKNLEFFASGENSLVVDKLGESVPLATLQAKEVVGIYFSAHWCGPCRSFTPKLAKVYEKCKEEGKSFEVVFVSSDQDKAGFEEYYNEMPWHALSFSERSLKTAISDVFDVQGIPTLALLTGKGEIITKDGRSAIESYEAAGFPFTEARLEECKKEKEESKGKAFQEMATSSFLLPLTTTEQSESQSDILSIAKSCEALAIAFVEGRDCSESCEVLSQLVDIQETLGGSKLSIIILPLEEIKDLDEELKTRIKDIPMVKFGERSKEIVSKFEEVLSEIEPPHVLVIGTSGESSLKIYTEDAASDLDEVGASGFPWSEEALEAHRAKEEALKEEVKAKQKKMEFFASGEDSHVVDKSGNRVPLTALNTKEVVGLYFSAHWCGPCRSFTPKLVELHNQCKEQGRSFEVVFVSWDESKKAFEEYYETMPWYALSFSERSLQSALSEHFDVYGIPTLVLLTGEGQMITDQGRNAAIYGVEYFPWKKEEMAKGKAAEEEKEKQERQRAKEVENNVINEQQNAKKIVLRRRIGAPTDVTISVAHDVEFRGFSTVAAPSAIIPIGKKVWYEVTFKEGDGVSQIGWATTEFLTSDEYESDGVGDCVNSYGFDGQRTCKWHDGETQWGKEFEPNGNRVLGVAADMENGRLLFGLDGDWGSPLGVAFENIDTSVELFPALTAGDMKLSVNFGDRDFSYGPPDPAFEKVNDVIKQV